jgi:small subunit ribosomal protein S30e
MTPNHPVVNTSLPRLQVEAQEKPKTPKGRAHKRDLYTRRFVNITLTPGGTRKMNANPTA